jgi:hypothetical protein
MTSVRGPAAVLRFTSPATARRRNAALGVLAFVSIAVALMATAASASADYRTEFRNHATGACLAWGGGERVYATHCQFDANTQWIVHTWGDRTIQLRPDGDRNRCLDDSRFGLRAFSPCWPGSSSLSRHQSWISAFHDNGYTLQNQATRWFLDDSREGLRMLPGNGTPFQKWDQGQFH